MKGNLRSLKNTKELKESKETKELKELKGLALKLLPLFLSGEGWGEAFLILPPSSIIESYN